MSLVQGPEQYRRGGMAREQHWQERLVKTDGKIKRNEEKNARYTYKKDSEAALSLQTSCCKVSFPPYKYQTAQPRQTNLLASYAARFGSQPVCKTALSWGTVPKQLVLLSLSEILDQTRSTCSLIFWPPFPYAKIKISTLRNL